MRIVINNDKIENEVLEYLNYNYDDEFIIVEKHNKIDFVSGAYILLLCKAVDQDDIFTVKCYLNSKNVDAIEEGINISDYLPDKSDLIIEETYKNIYYGTQYAEELKSILSQPVYVYCDMNIADRINATDYNDSAMPKIYVFYEIGTLDVDALIDEVQAFVLKDSFRAISVYICGSEHLDYDSIMERKNSEVSSFDDRLRMEFDDVEIIDFFYTMKDKGIRDGVQRVKG